ncbi:YggT family protein [Macrococcus armenti]|uniref:YggT family protein n=1 Tax=Macrococcus armenti TaxID=2875764 RepID=A0ABY4A2E3_9STAP|nr:YggT family protein [Macrococcus armenti]UBH13961.1 YggT family protein [Macrococcus armenti]UBH23193.1 YggT family protein [Macrococcus armenti]UOB21323.1 YggT family protein [Macrococcus armenti]
MNTFMIVLYLFKTIMTLLNILYWGMIIYFFMSWLPGARESKVGRMMQKVYEPILDPFRRVIPPLGMFDISSIAALIVFRFFMVGLSAIFNLILSNLI